MKRHFILLVNPWITDFAAYDLWAKPLGLLYLGALLREGGVDVALLDCLERSDKRPSGKKGKIIPGKEKFFGTGKYDKIPIEKPHQYRDIPRRYFRYGITEEAFTKRIADLPRSPDLILVTSIMTYWYPGVVKTIETLKRLLPSVPIWLGGIYARLCYEHAAKNVMADLVFKMPLEQFPDLLEAKTSIRLKNKLQWSDFSRFPIPCWDLIASCKYRVLLTSLGCPFHCSYCASRTLQPVVKSRLPDTIIREIIDGYEAGIKDFAFYDDALLISGWKTLEPVLKYIIREEIKVRFHTPNALHVRAITEEKSRLLFKAGFKTIRLGLETSSKEHQKKWGDKAKSSEFSRASKILLDTGWKTSDIGAYLLCGVPGQKPGEVKDSIDFVAEHGVLPFIAEYSPIPKTALWEKAQKISFFDLNEPLYHNNSFFACRRSDFTYEDMVSIKNYARKVRGLLVTNSTAISTDASSG